MNAETTEPRSSGSRRNRGWIWAGVIFGGLVLLSLTCVISTLWGGLVGYTLGRRSGHGPMLYESPFESVPEAPEMPGIPDMPGLAGRPWLGVTFVMTEEGARITAVTPDSPADDAGLRPDDVITEVDSRAVTAAQPLDELILRYDPGDRVALTVVRNGDARTVRVRLASWMEMQRNTLPMEPLWEG